MVSNYNTLACIARDLTRKFQGLRVREVYSQAKDELVLSFEGTETVVVVNCTPSTNTLYLHPNHSRARVNTASLFPSCVGDVVNSCQIHPSDRELFIALGSGNKLWARFFGPKANVFLTQADGKIVDSFINARKLVGRMLEPLPEVESPAMNIDAIFDSRPDLAAASALKASLPTLGKELIEETFVRSGIDPSLSTQEVTPAARKQTGFCLNEILSEVADPSPRVYGEVAPRGTFIPEYFSLIALRQYQHLKERVFDDVSGAIRFYLFGRKKEKGLQQGLKTLRTKMEKILEKDELTLHAIQLDSELNGKESIYLKAGMVILAHAGEIVKGTKSYSYHDGTSMRSLKLDPSLTPVQNAQSFFTKAKKSRAAREKALGRRASVQERNRRTAQLLERLNKIDSREGLQRYMKENDDDLRALGLGGKEQGRLALPFRTFVVDGGFQVLAGKSSANNDLLTMKHAKPQDFWFHARGSSGSHVVLKVGTAKGEPGKKAKEQAAAIAAYYSKMRKAKRVPVVMTEKKYVRKPKGSSPGSVVLERESVLFVEPTLPHNQETSRD
ncbi:MAG TPA: NFACT RNA binding domain-containing protein [Bacteroidota bacterium]